MIDAHPVQLRAEVLLHLLHQLAREALEVAHLRRVLGRDDEAEVMPIVLGPLRKRLRIGVLGLWAEQVRLLPIPGDALAAEIAEVCRERRGPRAMANDAGLDDGVARSAGQKPVGLHGGTLSAPEARAIALADLAGARDASAGPLCGGERLGDEGSCLLRAGRAYAARPDTEIVLAAHGRGSAHRAKPRKIPNKSRERRLRRSDAPRADAP